MKSPLADFVLIRILGNELSPRDLPGSRLRALEYIVTHEPPLPSTQKYYLLNRLIDEALHDNYIRMLNAHRCEWLRIDFDKASYLRSLTREDKVRTAIDINGARNAAIDFGCSLARFVVVLDGDCHFDQAAWDDLSTSIAKDQVECPERGVYFVPSLRCFLLDNGRLVRGRNLEEPMVIVRNDFAGRFDERLGFGRGGDKVEFLARTRHLAKTVSTVLHVGTGAFETEADTPHRCILREKSLDSLIDLLDSRLNLGT